MLDPEEDEAEEDDEENILGESLLKATCVLASLEEIVCDRFLFGCPSVCDDTILDLIEEIQCDNDSDDEDDEDDDRDGMNEDSDNDDDDDDDDNNSDGKRSRIKPDERPMPLKHLTEANSSLVGHMKTWALVISKCSRLRHLSLGGNRHSEGDCTLLLLNFMRVLFDSFLGLPPQLSEIHLNRLHSSSEVIQDFSRGIRGMTSCLPLRQKVLPDFFAPVLPVSEMRSVTLLLQCSLEGCEWMHSKATREIKFKCRRRYI